MSGFIYFLRCGEFVKIGFSTKPNIRTRALDAASPHDSHLVAVHPGTRVNEAQLHKLFAAHRKRGEWFWWCDEIEETATHGLPHFDTPTRKERITGRLRDITGLTLDELGRILGVKASTVLRWERGEFPPERVPFLEREFGIPRHELRPDLWPPSID